MSSRFENALHSLAIKISREVRFNLASWWWQYVRMEDQFDNGFQGWHSFDRTPWNHPWLTTQNLNEFREFSKSIRDEAAKVASGIAPEKEQFAFIGNMANSSYQRSRALQQIGKKVPVYPHPNDTFLMSQPEWEEFDGNVESLEIDWTKLCQDLPQDAEVFRIETRTSWRDEENFLSSTRISDYVRWAEYFAYSPLFEKVQCKDALYVVQAPYLGYLSGRPYITTQMGGEIWYECSRGDGLGILQRQAFARSTAITVSNPWSLAFGRRYSFKNMVFLPMILDMKRYCPGPPSERETWQERAGGDFFVVTTARMDEFFKGTSVALKGFAMFVERFPNSRLVIIGWGQDTAHFDVLLTEYGIKDKVIILPVMGKKKLLKILRSGDCLLDQFSLGYYGLTALEGMATGLPVVMRLESEQYKAFLEFQPPPVLQAETPYGVAEQLTTLRQSEKKRKATSLASLDWIQKSASPVAWGQDYINLLTCAAVGHKFDFRASPLSRPLTKAEEEYHREELENAPRFPNYV